MNETAIYLFPLALVATALVAASTGYFAGVKRGYGEGYRDAEKWFSDAVAAISRELQEVKSG